jgi:heme oxygenase
VFLKCPHLARLLERGGRTETPQSRDQAAMPLSVVLKELTRPQHDEAEGHPLHAVLEGRSGVEAAREAYVRLLWQHLRIQEVFEPLLRAASQKPPGSVLVAVELHCHLEALRRDLAALPAFPEMAEPLGATARFCSFIQQCAAHDGLGLLGVFYVFEGSTNGGTILAKRIAAVLGLEGGSATGFINPHGQLVRSRWKEWQRAADSLALRDVDRDIIVAAAQETFRHSRRVLDEVHGRMQVRN